MSAAAAERSAVRNVVFVKESLFGKVLWPFAGIFNWHVQRAYSQLACSTGIFDYQLLGESVYKTCKRLSFYILEIAFILHNSDA